MVCGSLTCGWGPSLVGVDSVCCALMVERIRQPFVEEESPTKPVGMTLAPDGHRDDREATFGGGWKGYKAGEKRRDRGKLSGTSSSPGEGGEKGVLRKPKRLCIYGTLSVPQRANRHAKCSGL